MDNPAYATGQEIGRIIGAFIALLVVTRLLLLAFKDKKYTVTAVVISLVIGTAIGILVTGSGILQGNPSLGGEAIASAATDWLIPAGAVLLIDLIRLWNRKSRERYERR